MTAAGRRADRGLILGREMLRASRRPGTWALRVGAVLFVSSFVIFSFAGAFSGRVEAHALADIGRSLFYLFLGLQVTLVLGLAPWFGASAMAEERDDQTLEILGLSPVTPGAVLFGKLLSRMLFLASAAAASVPLLLVVTSFGGSEPAHAVVAFIGTAAIALVLAAMAGLGALCGLRPVVATVLTWLWGFLVFAMEPFLVTASLDVANAGWAAPSVAIGRGEPWFLWSLLLWVPAMGLLLWATGPIFRIVTSAGDIDDLLSPERTALDRLWAWVGAGLSTLGVASVGLLLYGRTLRRLPLLMRSALGASLQTLALLVLTGMMIVGFLWLQSRNNAASAVRRAEGDVERPWRWRLSELGRGWLRGGPRGPLQNPILWREAAVGGAGTTLSRAALVMVLFLVFWAGVADGDLGTAAAVAMFFGLPSVFLVGMVTVVTVLGEERRGGTFPLLMLTHLSPGRYAIGVLGAAFWRVVPLAVLCLLSFAVYWLDEVGWDHGLVQPWRCEAQQLWLGQSRLRWLAMVAWTVAFWLMHAVLGMVIAARARPAALGMPAAAGLISLGWFVFVFVADQGPVGQSVLGWVFPMAQDGWTEGGCGVSPQQLGSPLLFLGASALGLLLLHGRLRRWALQ